MHGAAAEFETLGTLDYSLLPEASGLAVSTRDPQRLWFVNDSGNDDELISLDLGKFKFSRVEVKKAKNRDWEDLESFLVDGESWLMIADVGDNAAKRNDVTVYLLKEPDTDDDKVRTHTRIDISYPEGARDVESVAVDPVTQFLYLLSKREPSPRLYRVPLEGYFTGKKGEKHNVEAEFLGEVGSIPAPSAEEKRAFRKYGAFRHQPTGMAFLANSSTIAVMTYRGAYVAKLNADRDWLDALNQRLCAIHTPALAQGETIAADSRERLYVSSEGRRAPLIRLPARCTP